MIQTTGKRDPEKDAKALQQQRLKDVLNKRPKNKRPKKELQNLTAKEKQDAIDTMLEWFLMLEEE